jgi:hypothetical protein
MTLPNERARAPFVTPEALAAFAKTSVPALVVAAVYLLASLKFTQFRTLFEFDVDEGNNLIKALLLDRGHSFLNEIWSDQPPLFTYALLAIFKVSGLSVAAARKFVLWTSAALLFALYDAVFLCLRRTVGLTMAHCGAMVASATLLLASSFGFLRVSVMIGMPAIASATLAVWASLSASGMGRALPSVASRRRWLVLAGALFGLSLAIKLFTAYLLPIVLLTALAPDLTALRQRRFAPVGMSLSLWSAGFGVVLLLGFLPALRSGAASELLLSHWGSAELRQESRFNLGGLVVGELSIFILAALGLLLAMLGRLGAALPWVAWLFASLVALYFHRPLWRHHDQLLLVPAAALVGIGIGVLPALLKPYWRRGALPVVVGGTLLVLASAIAQKAPGLRTPSHGREERDRAALEVLRGLHLKDGYIVASRPIFAFYLGSRVPPHLSVTSLKRFYSGRLSARDVVEEIERYEVELVLLSSRWPSSVREHVRRAIATDYELVFRDPKNGNLEVFRRRPVDAEASGTRG